MTTDKFQTAREEAAEARAERCWPANGTRQFETRCDFREGADWAREFTLQEGRAHMHLRSEQEIAGLRAENRRLREGITQCILYMRNNGQMIDQQVVSVFEAQFALAKLENLAEVLK